MSAFAVEAGVAPPRVLRVLLVEDQLFLRVGIRAALRDAHDIEIVGEAGSFAEAIEIIPRLVPDVIVLDLDASAAPGTGAIRALLAGAPTVHLVALTRFSDDAQLVNAFRLGASAYLSGETAGDELAAAVRSAAAGELHVRPRLGNALAAAFRPPARAATTNARERYDVLSEREQTVLRLVAEGYSGPEIGDMLDITAKTVDTYRHRIQGKIGLNHRTQYVRLALQLDLLAK